MTTQDLASEIVGPWRLLEWLTEESGAASSRHPLGRNADGWLIYAPQGVMMVLMSGSERSVSYAGRWRVEADEVVHRVETAHHPSLVGSEQRRRITRRGDGLLLEGVERDAQGRERRHRVSWRRLEGRAEG